MSNDIESTKPQGAGTITTQDLDEAGRRWCMSVNGFNYETQLAPSVVFAESRILKKIYGDDDEAYRKSLDNAARYFNVTPPVAGLILGATVAMEEQKGNDALDAVQDFKVGLMGPLSGIGDAVIWVMIPTIFGSMAAYMAQSGNLVGTFIYIAAMLVCSLGVKVKSWTWGYKFGANLFTTLADKVSAFSESMSVLGLTVVGALIPSVVKVTTPLAFSFGEVSLGLQEGVLDKILVALLPVCVTAVIYSLVKKGVSTNKIILGIIVVSLLCNALGILA